MAPKAPRILAVDDDQAVRTFVERVLGEAGYEVSVAADAPTALTTIKHEQPVDLFLVDLVMPLMNGNELAHQLRRTHPDAKILYFTGYSALLFEEKSTLWEHEAFLEKPVTMKGLLEATSLLLFGHTDGPRQQPFFKRYVTTGQPIQSHFPPHG